MFGRKGLFGKKRPEFEEPKRRGFGPHDAVFNQELWEGEIGDFLRSAGFSPDDPINRLAVQEPISAQLAADKAIITRALEAANPLVEQPLTPCHLLPVQTWHGRFGNFLLKRLDLSPYRPWNTIFLPVGSREAAAFAHPISSDSGTDEMAGIEIMMEMIAELYSDKHSPEADAVAIMLDAIAGNFPSLFPPEILDLSPNVKDARRRVRAFAFQHGISRVSKETIMASHKAFLAQPEMQLVA